MGRSCSRGHGTARVCQSWGLPDSTCTEAGKDRNLLPCPAQPPGTGTAVLALLPRPLELKTFLNIFWFINAIFTSSSAQPSLCSLLLQFILESLKAKLDGKEAGWAEEQRFFPPDPCSDPWPGCPAVMGTEPLGSSRAAGTVQGWG